MMRELVSRSEMKMTTMRASIINHPFKYFPAASWIYIFFVFRSWMFNELRLVKLKIIYDMPAKTVVAEITKLGGWSMISGNASPSEVMIHAATHSQINMIVKATSALKFHLKVLMLFRSESSPSSRSSWWGLCLPTSPCLIFLTNKFIYIFLLASRYIFWK